MRDLRKTEYAKKYLPIICYSVFVLVFSLFFTELFVKTDDGHFMGIVSENGFTYKEWLTERYNTLSGRTVGELLLAFFIRQNVLLWKIVNAAFIIYLACFFYRLSGYFSGNFSDKHRQIICCSGLFMMLVSCLNPAVFWFSGSFFYLWPIVGVAATTAPLIFCILGSDYSSKRMLLSVLTAVLATMHEQGAACCTALYIILLAVIIYKKLPLKAAMFLPLIAIVLLDFHLLTAPGVAGRGDVIISQNFPQYADYGVLDKVFCGLSVFFANHMYLSNVLFLVLSALMSAAIMQSEKCSRMLKKALTVADILCAVVCIVANYAVAAAEKGLAHMIFRKAFLSDSFTAGFYLLFVLGCIVAAITLWKGILLIRRDLRTGFITGLCIAAAFCATMAVGMSSSAFVSGQRIAFYGNVFIIAAVVVLFSQVNTDKYTKAVYNVSAFYSAVSFAVECFAFRLFELPLMG